MATLQQHPSRCAGADDHTVEDLMPVPAAVDLGPACGPQILARGRNDV